MFHTQPNLFGNFFFILCHNLFISNSDMKLHIQPINNKSHTVLHILKQKYIEKSIILYL